MMNDLCGQFLIYIYNVPDLFEVRADADPCVTDTLEFDAQYLKMRHSAAVIERIL